MSSTYSPLCRYHKAAKARHGHPEQTYITKHELMPYVKAAKQWVTTRSRRDFLDICKLRWEALCHEARIYEDKALSGRPYHRPTMDAYQTVLKVNKENELTDIVITLISMGYLHECNPRRFKDQTAFGFQCARRLRSLAPNSIGSHWDNTKQKVKLVYRDVSPKVYRELVRMVEDLGFVGTGMSMAKADLKERATRKPKAVELMEAGLGNAALEELHN